MANNNIKNDNEITDRSGKVNMTDEMVDKSKRSIQEDSNRAKERAALAAKAFKEAKLKLAEEKRVYKLKNAVFEFYCPLCRKKRFFVHNSKLSKKNYLQLLIAACVLVLICYPIMGIRSLVMIFIVWASAELAIKLRHRKDIPCPYCGFDATWYKRDVKVARRLVKEFWSQKNVPQNPDSEKSNKQEPNIYS